jgi:hypothetical protein
MSDKTAQPAPPGFPPLEVPSDLEAIYINLVRIAHSPSELIFDFAHLLPGSTPARVRSRVVMSPLGAKLFHLALTENLSRYETTFGEIQLPGGKSLNDTFANPSTSELQK